MDRFNFSKRHKNFSQKLWDEVEKQPENLTKTQSTIESRKLYNQNRQVGYSLCLNMGFTRLKTSKHGILHGVIDPEHHIEDLICSHFVRRFPMYLILLQSKRGTFIGEYRKPMIKTDKSIKQLLPKLEKQRPVCEILSDLDDFDEEIYYTFHNSINIKERKNTPYFNRMFPKKYRKQDGVIQERLKFVKEKFELD